MRSNTYIMIHLLFALILLLFFVSLSRKWEINPKRVCPMVDCHDGSRVARIGGPAQPIPRFCYGG